MATGIVLGPYVLNLIDSSILNISSELRKIALIIILTRAGLGLDITGLKKIGRPAILMCFLPASFEKIHIRDTIKVLLILSISFILVATEDMLNTSIKFSALIAIMLVGATVNINYLGNMGIKALIVIFGALIFRMAGVFVCLIKTELNKKERLFTMMAYTPKATVQAAIGGIPLALNFACGETVLTIAVLAIVITAPLGAFAMDLSYKKLLRRNE